MKNTNKSIFENYPDVVTVEQLASMMKSAGFMLLFAFLYFQMLTEAGVFDTIVSAITTKLGNKMNVIVISVS